MTAPYLTPLLVLVALVAGTVVLRFLIRGATRRSRSRDRNLGRWFAQSPLFSLIKATDRWIARRSPRVASFMRRRFSPASFEGLALTVICGAIIVMVVAFSEIAEEILEAEEIVQLDTAILEALDPIRAAPLLKVFSWITQLGGNPALMAATVIGCAFLWARRQRSLLFGALVAIGGAQAALWIGKFGFNRTRPEFLFDVTAHSPSFPSGHTTGSMAVYGFLAFAAARMSDNPHAGFELGFWASVLIVLIGFSRIYLHVHFPFDVAGGFLIGGVWLLLGVAVTLWLEQQKSVAA